MGANKDRIVIAIILIAVVVIFFFSAILIYGIFRSSDGFALGGKVALVEIKGIIISSEDTIRQLKKYRDDSSIKGLVLRIDSPGGGVAVSQEIYDQLIKFKDEGKFIVASLGSIAASGGYYLACAADTVIANPGTMTGSIGVIFSFLTFDRLMNKAGVEHEVFKSGNFKDFGNFARDVSPAERKMIQSLIDDTHDQFINLVAESRGLDLDYARSLADGSIFTGRQALEKELIDDLGTLEDAISKAGEMAGLGKDPRVVRERPRRRYIWEYAMRLLGIDIDFFGNSAAWPVLEYRYSR